jgi:dihydrofolate synthase/folylpolyglutamate synthase
VLLDCAHNVASAEALVQALRASYPLGAAGGKRYLIFAGSRDKDLAGMLAVLAPHFERLFLTRFHTSQRGVPPEQAAALLPAEHRAKAVLSESSAEAWRQARATATERDLICVAGSVFLAGELRPLLVQEG